MMAGLVGRTAPEPMASILCTQERAYARLQADREECNFFVLACTTCWRVLQWSLRSQKPHPHLDTGRAGHGLRSLPVMAKT
jgi:hypothetical protein